MTKPRLKIYRYSNGWLLKEQGAEPVIIEEREYGPDGRDPASLLWEISDILGLGGDRFDAKRLSIGYKPGDKHHDYHPKPCSECDCQCDPDQSQPEPDDRDLSLLDEEVFDGY
jgi:hypothetical protein